MDKVGVKVKIVFQDIVWSTVAETGQWESDHFIVKVSDPGDMFSEHRINLNGFNSGGYVVDWEHGQWTDNYYQHCFTYEGDDSSKWLKSFIRTVKKGINEWVSKDKRFLINQDLLHQAWKTGLSYFHPSAEQSYEGWRRFIVSVSVSQSKIYPTSKMNRKDVKLWGYDEVLLVETGVKES